MDGQQNIKMSVHVLEKTANKRTQQCSQNACAEKLEKGVKILS